LRIICISSSLRQKIREYGQLSGSLHSLFATRLSEAGYDIRTVQELMGHRDVTTTQVYTHVLHRGGSAVRSAVDTLSGAAAA